MSQAPAPTLPTPTSAIAPTTSAPLRAKVDAWQHRCPGTTLRVILGIVALTLMILITGAITWGVALILWGIGLAVYFTRLSKARAALRGSAIRVSANQFPQVYAAAIEMCERLGLPEVPEIFIAHASQPNAMAMRLGSRTFVLLYDDVLVGASRCNNPQGLDWILAHELAHHALGHTNLFRRSISANYAALSRRDEFSCDAVAHALIGDERTAHQALTLLMVGGHLFDRVDHAALAEQIREVNADKNSRKAESTMRMTHPLLLRRMARISGPIKL
jgi:Zn-dependent protease with chaperone function